MSGHWWEAAPVVSSTPQGAAIAQAAPGKWWEEAPVVGDAGPGAGGLEIDIDGGTPVAAEMFDAHELGRPAPVAALGDSASDKPSFGQNFVAGLGRTLPNLGRGIQQIGAEAFGALGDLAFVGSPELGRGHAMASGLIRKHLQREAAEERQSSEALMGTGGGFLGNLVGEVGITAPLGGVGLAARGASALRGALGAGASGGLMAALQPEATDGERERNMALGAGVGGGLSVMGRGAMALGENLLPNNVTARALNVFQRKANQTPFAQEGEALAQRTGIDLSPGAISGSRAMTGAENMSRSSLFSADKAFEADERVAGQAIQHIERTMDRISPTSASAAGVGDRIQQTVRGAVDKIIDARETGAARQYGAVQKLVGDRPVVTYDATKNALRGIIDEYTDVVGADARRVRTQAQRLLDEMSAKDGFTLDAARRARGFYGKAAARSANVFSNVDKSLDARLAGRLYGAMSDDLDAAALKIDELAGFGQNMPAQPGVTATRPSEMLRQANEDYRNYSQLLKGVQMGPLRRLLGDEIAVGDAMTVNTLPPETVVQRVNAMKPGEVDLLKRLMQNAAPDDWQQYKRLIVEDALSEAQTFPASAGARTLPFNAGGFIRAIGGDKPDKVERLKALMEPGEMAEIMDALQASRRLGDSFGRNFSGTGPYNEMVSAIRNFTVTGLSTTATTAAGFNKIARMMLDADGRRAVIELSRLPPQSKQANDLAAYLASFGAVKSAEPAPMEIDIVGGTPVPAQSSL